MVPENSKVVSVDNLQVPIVVGVAFGHTITCFDAFRNKIVAGGDADKFAAKLTLQKQVWHRWQDELRSCEVESF